MDMEQLRADLEAEVAAATEAATRHEARAVEETEKAGLYTAFLEALDLRAASQPRAALELPAGPLRRRRAARAAAPAAKGRQAARPRTGARGAGAKQRLTRPTTREDLLSVVQAAGGSRLWSLRELTDAFAARGWTATMAHPESAIRHAANRLVEDRRLRRPEPGRYALPNFPKTGARARRRRLHQPELVATPEEEETG